MLGFQANTTIVSFIVCILGAQTQVLMLANQTLSQLRYHPPISLISNSRKYNVWIIYLHLSKLPGLSLKLSFSSSRLAADLHEVSSSRSSLLGQELRAGKDSSFMLEDHGGDHLVYMANQMLKPETLVSHYENDQGSAAMASLTSGKNMDR